MIFYCRSIIIIQLPKLKSIYGYRLIQEKLIVLLKIQFCILYAYKFCIIKTNIINYKMFKDYIYYHKWDWSIFIKYN